jgi:hypothetical protein
LSSTVFDSFGIPLDRSATSQESRNGTNEDEHELQQYSHANGIPKESKTVEDKLLDYARIELFLGKR